MWAVVLTSTVPMNTEFDPRWLQKYAHVDTCTHNQAHARMYTHTMARTYNTGMHIYMCAVVHVHINGCLRRRARTHANFFASAGMYLNPMF